MVICTAVCLPLIHHTQLLFSCVCPDGVIRRVLDGGQFVLGQEVQEFETEFAHYLNAGATLGVASGTDAIELMLRALDIGPGDKVVVPALTADASAAGVRRAGAEVLLADIDAATFFVEADTTWHECKQGVVSAHADVQTGSPLGATLTDNDVTDSRHLVAENLDPKTLRNGITAEGG